VYPTTTMEEVFVRLEPLSVAVNQASFSLPLSVSWKLSKANRTAAD
jgi:hypothetical protein